MVHPQPFHLPTPRGPRFCVRYEPRGGPSEARALVHVPAFAEEMNKSRRMVALQSRALAGAGWLVVVPDLLCCGDSEGDTADAQWAQWVSDIVDTVAWARGLTGRSPALWGLRTGCLLAAQVADDLAGATDLLMWQPVISGAQALAQFLRTKVASQLVGATPAERVGTRDLLSALRRGVTLEIAGYSLAPELALALEAARLDPPRAPGRVAWLEVSAAEPPCVSPAAQARIEAWRAAGHDVAARAVAGPPFWQTQEIMECPQLIEATLAALDAWPHAR